MKVVTAAAALDSGEFTPDGPQRRLAEEDRRRPALQTQAASSFGDIDMTDA